MFIDARTLINGTTTEADICIVGAGAAGITIAKELVNTQYKVLMLESGGMKFNHRTQSLYQAKITGREYQSLEFTKRRQFGGSTVTWFGRCRPLDDRDFETRSWLPFSGWPFPKSHLDPFYERAKEYCQLTSNDYQIKPDYFTNGVLETKRFYFSPPTNFGEMYQSEIRNSHNTDVFLYTNAVNVLLEKNGSQVSGVVCKTLEGKTFHIRAKVVILAASALENTRLLLVSRGIHPNGIGNQYDVLGRFFMEHPHFFTGVINFIPEKFPSNYTKLNYDLNQKNLEVVDAIGLKHDFMERESLLNACVFLVNRPLYKVKNIYYSAKSIGFIKLMEVLQHSAPLNIGVLKNLMNVLKNSNSVASLLSSSIYGKLKNKRQYTLRMQMETVPNPESYVTLSDKKDTLGVRQIALHWKTTSMDTASFQRFEHFLTNGLQKVGMDVKPFDHDYSSDGWPVSMRPGKHHMGTTRMHKDEKRGVVNEHCQVHGVNNLYVAGSSIFPTSGMANPTLTIVALAIRLADQIKNKLRE